MNSAICIPASIASRRLLRLVALAASLPLLPAAHAQNVNATLAGAGGTANWGDSATWDPATVPNATDAVVNISGSFTANLALDLQDASNVNQTYSFGNLTFKDTTSAFRDLSLQNGAINVATTSKTATWTQDSSGGIINLLSTVSITAAADQALILTNTNAGTANTTDTAGSAIRFNSSATWTNFLGGLTFAKGIFQANGGNSLPQNMAITLGGGTDVAYLRLVGGQSQQLAALNGNAQSFVHTQSATTAGTLAINSALDGTFAGTVGTNGNGGFTSAGITITKTGNGTQTFSGAIVNPSTTVKNSVSVSGGTLVLSGANTYRGTTTVNSGGTLVFSGTHFADSGETGTGTMQGNYVVNAGGTLRGTGTIRPFVDSITGGGVTVSVRGTINAGLSGSDFGTLTIDGQNSVKSMFIVESTGVWTVDIGAGGNDRIKIVNAATNDFRFVNSATIAFNDLSGGSISGNFIIGETDLLDGTAFTNLAGVTITGLNAYDGNYTLAVSGGNLVLSIAAIPEPSAYAAFLGAGVLGLATLRRRRR